MQEQVNSKASQDTSIKGLGSSHSLQQLITNLNLDERIINFEQRRKELVEIERKMYFSYDLEESFTEEERSANMVLHKIRRELKNDTYNASIHDYFQNFDLIRNSEMYKVLDTMPKGGLHHLHTTAAPSVDFYIQLTYNECVYFNEREKLFKVAPNGLDEDGYVRCVEMRKFWSSAEDYDRKLRDYIRMTPEECKSKESHGIWEHFQHKFTLINDLGKYQVFFKQLLYEILIKCAEQNIFIVELRHIFGMIFDDNRKPIPLEEELQIFEDTLLLIKQLYPYFELRLIITGLKIIGRAHIHQMISNIIEGSQFSDLIAGFDLVNEEDFTPPILEFLQDILDGKKKDKMNGLPCFFHSGETHDRNNENLYDALLLNSKRIGHGFQLALQPHLQQQIKERDICIEACPVSNLLLGYTLDLRNHPVKFMLTKGIQVSINSDDPGFFGYEGVTMDYVYATVAWDLELIDLKKLSLNGITYSTLSEKQKQYMKEEVFPAKWKQFITSLNNYEEKQ